MKLGEAARFSASRMPRFGVAVAVEYHALVLLDDLGQDRLQRLIEVLASFNVRFEFARNVIQRLGHDRVQHGVRPGDRLPGETPAQVIQTCCR